MPWILAIPCLKLLDFRLRGNDTQLAAAFMISVLYTDLSLYTGSGILSMQCIFVNNYTQKDYRF